MRPKLRDFQADLKTSVYQDWNQGAQNVVMQLATGGGKTVTLTDIAETHHQAHGGFVVIEAHRQELVGQLSTTLARYGLRHRIVGTDSLRRGISQKHVAALGRSLIDQTAPFIVASVDSLIRADVSEYAAQVKLQIPDEAHHVVQGNKWGRSMELFPNAKGLLPTATPCRADNRGLGRPSLGGHGYADTMVQGPPMRWLINNKFLSDYRIVAPLSDLQVLGDVGASGDWSSKQLKEAAQRSHIVGDIVSSYLQYGGRRPGATFCTDVETAIATVKAYKAAGVPAEVLTGDTDDIIRRDIIRRLEEGEILQIVAVDIISEGFDLPAIEVLVMARPTASYSLYAQQFGRALRIMAGKVDALIIDLVGNIIRHQGPPDRPRIFTLAGTKGSRQNDALPYRRCPICTTPYEASAGRCPECGHKPEPATRSVPAAVAGEVGEMSAELLARLRGDIETVDLTEWQVRSAHARDGWSAAVSGQQVKNHLRRQHAQHQLRAGMAIWAAPYRAAGYDDGRIQRVFFHLFGLSVLEAQALGAAEAITLLERLMKHAPAL